MATVGIVHLLAASLIFLICVPLLRRRVPRNYWYGVRIPAALASDDAWYAYNEYFARRMLAAALPVGLWAIAEIFLLERLWSPWRQLAPWAPLVFIAIPVIQTVLWRPPPSKPSP